MSSNRWLIGALVLSLALNLAVAGFAVGRMGSERGAGPIFPTFGASRALRELPEARQQQLRPLYRGHIREIRPHIRELRRVQRQLGDALTAEPFDRVALESGLADFRQALQQSQTVSHHALVELAAAMTVEERALLRESIASRRRPSRPHDARPDRADQEDRDAEADRPAVPQGAPCR